MERSFVAAAAWAPADEALGAVAARTEADLIPCAEVAGARAALEPGTGALVVDFDLEGAESLVYEIRANEQLAMLPIVAVLAEATDGEAVRALSLGADDFVLREELDSQLPPKLQVALTGAEPQAPLRAARTVLFGDPSELHRAVLGRLLGQAGFHVTIVADGPQAAAALATAEEPFDLLVFDLGLADPGPVELLDRLRERDEGALPPAIALSHVGIPDAAALRALTSGFRTIHDKRRPPEDLVFLCNETDADAHEELRASPRLLCSTLARWCVPGRPWQVGLIHNLSMRGLYLRAIDAPSIGTTVEVSFIAPGLDRELDLRARVAWRKDFSARAVRSYPTGMGLALEDLPGRTADALAAVARILASSRGQASR